MATKEPLSTNKNHKFGSEYQFYPRWGNGIGFTGNTSIKDVQLDYNIMITNGNQEYTNRYEEDNNTMEAIATRIRLTPKRGLKIGFYMYEDVMTEYEEIDNDLEPTGGRIQLFSYGTHVEWTHKDFGLEIEGVQGTINPTPGETIKRSAYTAMIYYTIKE
ncbi:MAG: hypothetical protein HRT72_09405 [Flavobacteriales bacterium]|nr:hypothetical protein [Flavobacteriales bacterium]